MSRPRFIGLTGGIGAGKSEALAALARLGAKTISSDAIVHELLGTAELRERLVERWGEEVAVDGEVDRARVAEIVFERPEELAWLESELFPRVGERLAAWRASLPPDVELAVVEVPLLFESGIEGLFDATVCVVADEEQRHRRAAGRGHVGLEGRASRQLSQEEKAGRATFTIANDGSIEDLEARLSQLMRSMLGEERH